MVTSGEGLGKRWEGMYGIERYYLLSIKCMGFRDILYNTGECGHYFVVNLNRVQPIKMLSGYVVHLKLIQCCKSSILQF